MLYGQNTGPFELDGGGDGLLVVGLVAYGSRYEIASGDYTLRTFGVVGRRARELKFDGRANGEVGRNKMVVGV